MTDCIARRLASLAGLSKTALRELWQELFKVPPPSQLRRELALSILSYRLQEEAFGALTVSSRRKLTTIAQAIENNPDTPITNSPRIKPGTRLIRQWGDQVHLVNVESSGYEYQGARYKNLSEIARLITGTRWSGPLFFGIKSEQVRKSKEAR
jgi:Protein of unknown function (DUF2924)